MSIKVIQEKIDSYRCTSHQEEDHALKEITQELILNSLYNAGFFKKAAFHGGTCLRILYGLSRFSEDLDFALLEPDSSFALGGYLTAINDELKSFGYDIQIVTRESDRNVKNAFLKDNSLGRILKVQHSKKNGTGKILNIKLEVDTNPPSGAEIENKFIDFPIYFAVTTHDLPTLFGGKSHALLCREYVKGRDWFDFLWYLARKTPLNYSFLSNALDQHGPWQGKKIQVDAAWYADEMKKRIKTLDWVKAKIDVQRFLRPIDVKTLDHWSTEFFLDCLNEQFR
ncbi:MAG: nucleotidyl transferase AbiEii/AbiGii toxin family protein [Proteobacteria bacterium]|nr:nucleotidyl transferase AbiEii/AbiGii toxin family protein [Pseudomonadota bacterium]